MHHVVCRTLVLILTLALLLTQRLNAEDLNYFDSIGFANPTEILKLDPGIYQSLPAVYRVHVSGKAKFQFPSRVEFDHEQLNQDYDDFRSAVDFPAGTPRSIVQWVQIAAIPDRYLRPSSELTILEFGDGPLGSGTCYAIDRNGILVTNRHVVESVTDKILEDNEVLCHKPPSLSPLLANLIDKLGQWNEKNENDEFVRASLFGWFGAQCKRTTKVTKVEIEVAYSKKNWYGQTSQQLAATLATELFEQDTRKATLVPAQILAMGEPGDENDIAILKIDGNVRDALICLDFAQPQEFQSKARVYSLGFPGYRYDFVDQNSR
ncbi:MAG: hypothetical protein ABL921_28395, partial [Pirellula sp.]